MSIDNPSYNPESPTSSSRGQLNTLKKELPEPKTFSFQTSNDNLSPFNPKKTTNDDGHTYGLGMSYTEGSKTFYANYDSFTRNPRYDFYDGTSMTRNDNSSSSRVDRFQIGFSNKYQEYLNQNTRLDTSFGLGVYLTGNLGGQNVQNSFHEFSQTANYSVHAPYYEPPKIGAFVTGGMGLETKVPFNIPAVSSYIGAKVSTILGTGPNGSSIDGQVYGKMVLGGNTTLNLGIGTTKTTGISSETIRYGTPEGPYAQADIALKLTPELTISAGYKGYSNAGDKGNKGTGTLGINYNF